MNRKLKTFVTVCILAVFIYGIIHTFLPHEEHHYEVTCDVCKIVLSGIISSEIPELAVDALLPLAAKSFFSDKQKESCTSISAIRVTTYHIFFIKI